MRIDNNKTNKAGQSLLQHRIPSLQQSPGQSLLQHRIPSLQQNPDQSLLQHRIPSLQRTGRMLMTSQLSQPKDPLPLHPSINAEKQICHSHEKNKKYSTYPRRRW